jgi:hypothetical protein
MPCIGCAEAANAHRKDSRVAFWKAAKTMRALRKAGKDNMSGWCEAVSAAHAILIY